MNEGQDQDMKQEHWARSENVGGDEGRKLIKDNTVKAATTPSTCNGKRHHLGRQTAFGTTSEDWPAEMTSFSSVG